MKFESKKEREKKHTSCVNCRRVFAGEERNNHRRCHRKRNKDLNHHRLQQQEENCLALICIKKKRVFLGIDSSSFTRGRVICEKRRSVRSVGIGRRRLCVGLLCLGLRTRTKAYYKIYRFHFYL